MRYRTTSLACGSLLGMALLALSGMSGCADPAATIRKATYPPEFKYVSRSELQTTMAMLARDLERLDVALSPGQPATPIDQGQVRRILAEIDDTARALEAGDVGSNHPFLKDQLGLFLSDVELAMTAASLEPPRYYAAGKLAGGCTNCHRINR